jgi:hypothetical protein
MYQEGCDDDVMSCLKNKEIYVAVVIDVVLVELTATETHVCLVTCMDSKGAVTHWTGLHD